MRLRVMAINLVITMIVMISLMVLVQRDLSQAENSFNRYKEHIVTGAQGMTKEPLMTGEEAGSEGPILLGGRVLTDCHTQMGKLNRSTRTFA